MMHDDDCEDIEVKRNDELVALFKGVVYRTQKDWEE